MLHGYKNVHFVGIGGLGMSGLAEILLSLGYQVTGSDLVATDITRRLALLGASVYVGHQASHVAEDVDLLVYSAAVDATNLERVVAQERGIPSIVRGELLADITRLKQHVVAVAGSHGKTTTTSMIADVLWAFDVESTVIVGGVLQRQGSCAKWGRGDILVSETDEHDGSFLKLAPTIAVVTNIDFEHVEYYENLEALKDDFVLFMNKVPFYGFTVLCLDDPALKSLQHRLSCRCLTYGWDAEADLYAQNVEFSNNFQNPWARFDVYNTSPRLGAIGHWGRVELKTLGRHNVLNALAALATGVGFGLAFDLCVRGLKNFTGIQRRMGIYPLHQGYTLIEDYAHHPTEIRATLESVESPEGGRRIVVFQPHLYSRTAHFAEEFATELCKVDQVIVLPIYPAREEPIEGVNAFLLAELMQKKGFRHVTVLDDKTQTLDVLASMAKKGDVVFVLGAGDIYKVAEDLKHETLSQRDLVEHS